MRFSDWSSDVCSSDLANLGVRPRILKSRGECLELFGDPIERCVVNARIARRLAAGLVERVGEHQCDEQHRSEEHTSELQSLMRISYAVFCLKKKNLKKSNTKMNT